MPSNAALSRLGSDGSEGQPDLGCALNQCQQAYRSKHREREADAVEPQPRTPDDETVSVLLRERRAEKSLATAEVLDHEGADE